MNSRIKQVRNALGLSQDEFGKKLGVTRGAITNIELNKVEPKPLFVSLICQTFNVSDRWLRTGEGEMFVKLSPEDEIAAFMGDVLKDEPDNFRRQFIAALARMDDSGWAVLEKFINDFNDKKREAQD